jgi:hypothetical protein
MKLLLPVCTVHYNRAPVTSATPRVWIHNSLIVQIMFISSHEIECPFSNKTQRLVYQKQHRQTKQRLRDTRSVPLSFLVHSSVHIPPPFFTPLTIVNFHIFLYHLPFLLTAHTLDMMMMIDHDDKFLPALVMMSPTAWHVYIRRQCNGTHYNNSAQHNAQYNSTKHTTHPLPGKSQLTHLSAVNVHNARPIDSVHFAQPMSHNSTYTILSIVHLCNDRPAGSTRIVSYIGRQYARTVPNVAIVGHSKCHTRHLATGGVPVAPFTYVLVRPMLTVIKTGKQKQNWPRFL